MHITVAVKGVVDQMIVTQTCHIYTYFSIKEPSNYETVCE